MIIAWSLWTTLLDPYEKRFQRIHNQRDFKMQTSGKFSSQTPCSTDTSWILCKILSYSNRSTVQELPCIYSRGPFASAVSWSRKIAPQARGKMISANSFKPKSIYQHLGITHACLRTHFYYLLLDSIAAILPHTLCNCHLAAVHSNWKWQWYPKQKVSTQLNLFSIAHVQHFDIMGWGSDHQKDKTCARNTWISRLLQVLLTSTKLQSACEDQSRLPGTERTLLWSASRLPPQWRNRIICHHFLNRQTAEDSSAIMWYQPIIAAFDLSVWWWNLAKIPNEIAL